MADEVDQGSLATDDLDKARSERDEFVATERGLPESASNDNPLPLEAIDTMVNKAEGDHEALAENAYQEKTVREADGVSFNGLTSVDEQALERQREDMREASDADLRTGADAASPAASESSSDSTTPDATDAAKALAAENSVDVADVKGTGADGRVTKDDVQAHLDAQSS